MKKNIFLAYTPYHSLLLAGKALSDCAADENCLFLIADFDKADRLADNLRSWSSCPFKEITVCEGGFIEDQLSGWEVRRMRYWVKRQRGLQLRRFIKERKITHVYLCNDQKTPSQYILRECLKRKISCDFLEDGSYIYQSHKVNYQQSLSVLISKLFFGLWWKDVVILGLNKSISTFHVAYPDIIRPELRHLPIKKLNPQILLCLKGTQFIQSYFNQARLGELNAVDVLFIVPHSEFFGRHPEYKKVFEVLMGLVSERKVSLVLKYHPREPKQDYLNLSQNPNCFILANDFPIEVLYLNFKGNIKTIVGDVSTALFTAKWVLNETTVISLAQFVGSKDAYFVESARKIGLKMPANETELRALL